MSEGKHPESGLVTSHKTLPSSHLSERVKLLSRAHLSATPWTVVYRAPLSMEFSRQEYWSVLPFPSPGNLPNPEIESGYPMVNDGRTRLGHGERRNCLPLPGRYSDSLSSVHACPSLASSLSHPAVPHRWVTVISYCHGNDSIRESWVLR